MTRIPFHDENEIKRGIEAFAAEPNGGLVVTPPTPTIAHRAAILKFAAEHSLPVIFEAFGSEGALMSYGPDYVDLWRHGAAEYVDRILRGAKAGDLPVRFPTRFELVLNLRTAKALGLDIPSSLLLQADEVIE